MPFYKTFITAFTKLVNPKLTNLTDYCDKLLKSGQESELVNALSMIKYIIEKDVLCAYFTTNLSRRLLLNKVNSLDLEMTALSLIKNTCSISKMEGMLIDFKQPVYEFQNYSVQVLTYGKWPSIYKPKVDLPSFFNKCKTEFNTFYKKHHSARRLTWFDSLGFVILKFKKHDIQVTTLQSLILFMLQDLEQASYTEIKNHLNIEDCYLKPLLHSLSCTKHKIVLKNDDPKKVQKNDIFKINYNFTSPFRSIKMGMVNMEEIKQIENVSEDRKAIIESNIVRTMKVRRVLNFSVLITSIQSQIQLFPVTIPLVKKHIESLIEREFIKRSDDDRNIIIYIA